jgi:hypothetical protein
MEQFSVFLNVFYYIWLFIKGWWWVFTPIILLGVFWDLFEIYAELKYLKSLEWVLLEVRIPKLILKTPKAMENIFSSLHAIATPMTWFDQTFNGKVQNWLSLEIVGKDGGTHFYIRTLAAYRNFVEAQIYAQYTDAEIHEVKDYVMDIPQTIPDEEYDMWGAEFKLTKEDAYPIRTYEDFEEMVEERRVDPMSSLTEFLAKLKSGEQMWLQFNFRPAPDSWKKEGEELVKQLTGKGEKKKDINKEMMGHLGDIVSGFFDVLTTTTPADPKAQAQKAQKDKKEQSQIAHLSPRQRDIVKEIEENISKLGFYTTVRMMYVAKKDSFFRTNIAGVVGFFKQFNTLDMNGFALNGNTITGARYFFTKSRTFMKKREMFRKYRFRVISSPFVLNTEEIATVCHFPASAVFSPMLPKIEAKRGEPPAGLPLI